MKPLKYKNSVYILCIVGGMNKKPTKVFMRLKTGKISPFDVYIELNHLLNPYSAKKFVREKTFNCTLLSAYRIYIVRGLFERSVLM